MIDTLDFPTVTSEDVEDHIEECDVCGDGAGVCFVGYLLALREEEEETEA